MIMMVAGGAAAQTQSPDRNEGETPRRANDQPNGQPNGDIDTMPRITNDSREYCDVLRQDIARIRVHRGELPPEPSLLAQEGERMCQMGHFRPGIYRLRSALIMLRP
jgi:hypothetical protein